MSRRIVIEFLGKDKNLGSTTSDVDHKTSRLGDTLKKVGKIAAIGLAAGAVVAGKALFDMTKAAMEDEASQAKLAATLRKNAGATDGQVASVEKWISAQGRALGVTDDELRPALERLVTATHDVGDAQKLASLAMDVSAGTGKSLESVSTALMKAQNGQVSSLSRLGINTKNAAGETITMEQATKRMAATFGGQAAVKADTLQGKMGRLKLIFDETKESIGAKLIPIVTKMADWFMAKGMPAIQKFGRELGDKLGPVLADVGDWVRTKLVPALQDLVGEVVPLARKYMPQMKDAFSDARPLLSLLGKIITDVLIPGIGKLAKVAIPWMVTQFRLVMKIINGVGAVIKWLNGVIDKVFGAVIRTIGKVIGWFGRMLQTIGKAPGMGWVGTLGDKLVGAGGKAQGLADKIQHIPDSSSTKINVDDSDARRDLGNLFSSLHNLTDNAWTAVVDTTKSSIGKNAGGTPYWRGGLSWVGERGPELVDLPRGSRVVPSRQSLAMAGSGGDITIVLQLDGREVHRSLLRQKRLSGKSLGLT